MRKGERLGPMTSFEHFLCAFQLVFGAAMFVGMLCLVGQIICCAKVVHAAPCPYVGIGDLDCDGDVDGDDFGILQRCTSGPGIAPKLDCWKATPTPTPPNPLPLPQPKPTIYVATYGSDTAAGTADAPLRNIGTACGKCKAGDVIGVADGVYAEAVLVQNKPGTKDAPIRLQASGKAIIDGGNARKPLFLLHCDWWVIEGFEVRGSIEYGIHNHHGSNVRIQLCKIHDNARSGIGSFASDDVEICRNDIWGNKSGVLCSSDYVKELGKYLGSNRPSIHHNLVYRNLTGGEDGDGITANAGVGAVIEYNLTWENADDGIDNSASGGGGNPATGQTIRYNCSWRNGRQQIAGGDGSGIKASTNAGGDNTFRFNIAFDNLTDGFNCDQEGDFGPNRFLGNTSAYNGRDGIGLDMAGVSAARSAAIVQDNIFAFNAHYDVGTAGQYVTSSADYNLLEDGQWTIPKGTGSLSGDPKFTSSTCPTINTTYAGTGGIEGRHKFIYDQIVNAFRLQPASPCIGKASDGSSMGAVQ